MVLGPDTVVQPDLLVAPRAAITETELQGAPLLAVEVLSPSTTHIDHGLKRQRYVEAAASRGHDPLTVESPYLIRVVPSELVT